MRTGKDFTLGLAIVLLIGSFVSVPLLVKADSRTTITVPDDFPTITAAIANASNGDTILVKNGTYKETAWDTNKSNAPWSRSPINNNKLNTPKPDRSHRYPRSYRYIL